MMFQLKSINIFILTIFVLIFKIDHIYSIELSIDQAYIENEWNEFKLKFSKNYIDSNEELKRKEIFKQNLQLILEHNSKYDNKLITYQLGVNQFADWKFEEFRKLVRSNNLKMGKKKSHGQIYKDNNFDDLPDEVDWTKKGVVTPVKNMGNCGDGYAFGPVQALESHYALKTGKLVSLSEQQVVDCSQAQYNNGCEGGLIDNTFDYIVANNHSIDTEQSYPYVGPNSVGCQSALSNKKIGATMKTYVDLPRFSEDHLQSAVAKVGPVAISLDADSPHFMLYKSGVYNYQDCNMIFIDHGMTVVGYGILNGHKYWKIKNSMGTTWGVDGYFLIDRGNNLCGIASTPSYPVV